MQEELKETDFDQKGFCYGNNFLHILISDETNSYLHSHVNKLVKVIVLKLLVGTRERKKNCNVMITCATEGKPQPDLEERLAEDYNNNNNNNSRSLSKQHLPGGNRVKI